MIHEIPKPLQPTPEEPKWVVDYNNVDNREIVRLPAYESNPSEFEKHFPHLSREFRKIQDEQYELFGNKMLSYGISNIALGTNLETEGEKAMSVTSIFIRCWDKVNRLKSLMTGSKNNIKDESIEDTWKDLSVYGIIAQLVIKDKWKK